MQQKADLSKLTSQEKTELIELLEEKKRRLDAVKYLSVYKSFYNWQFEFVKATSEHHECCLCAANQIGKTYLGTAIDAVHLLGEYPEDWDGHIFDFAPSCWGLGYSMEKTRDLLQTGLFGEYGERGFSGGLVPKDRIEGWESATGTPNAMRTVRVKHKLGTSFIQFWSYSQGQHAIMGDVVDWVHIDEEPKDQNIRPQVVTRTINGDKGKGGRIIYTFTPENGRTDLVIKFMENPSPDQFFMKKGWDDAPHMTKEKKERLLNQYPSHQRDMRSKGDPMLGHGLVYDLLEDSIKCDPFPIPDHWFVINGMDFGWNHPQAHTQLVEDRDNGSFYVTKGWKQSKVSANEAWGVVKGWNLNIPVAWPHDGLQNEKGRDDAVQQKVHYSNAGFKMLPQMATWPAVFDGKGGTRSGGNSVEHGLYELNDLMLKGKFKIFSGLVDVFDEHRQYHRDDRGKIVKVRDDLLDSIRYAYMMRRYAVKIGTINKRQKHHIPKPLGAMGGNNARY